MSYHHTTTKSICVVAAACIIQYSKQLGRATKFGGFFANFPPLSTDNVTNKKIMSKYTHKMKNK